jgi:tRNA threonylcarbamoyladenosine biosynthesis protein TsaE
MLSDELGFQWAVGLGIAIRDGSRRACSLALCRRWGKQQTAGAGRLHRTSVTRRCGILMENASALSHGGGVRVSLPTAAHTAALGRKLAVDARPGSVLCLRGDLGAGKTSLARAYVRAVRCDPTLDVTSPTYTLVNSYSGSVGADGRDIRGSRRSGENSETAIPDIYHIDLWRLKDVAERALVDFEHVFAEHISLVEWPDRLGKLTPARRLDVWLDYNTAEGDRTDIVIPESKAIDDPWGFLSDDETEDSLSTGRTAILVPHGKEWIELLQRFLEAPHNDAVLHGDPEVSQLVFALAKS